LQRAHASRRSRTHRRRYCTVSAARTYYPTVTLERCDTSYSLQLSFGTRNMYISLPKGLVVSRGSTAHNTTFSHSLSCPRATSKLSCVPSSLSPLVFRLRTLCRAAVSTRVSKSSSSTSSRSGLAYLSPQHEFPDSTRVSLVSNQSKFDFDSSPLPSWTSTRTLVPTVVSVTEKQQLKNRFTI